MHQVFDLLWLHLPIVDRIKGKRWCIQSKLITFDHFSILSLNSIFPNLIQLIRRQYLWIWPNYHVLNLHFLLCDSDIHLIIELIPSLWITFRYLFTFFFFHFLDLFILLFKFLLFNKLDLRIMLHLLFNYFLLYGLNPVLLTGVVLWELELVNVQSVSLNLDSLKNMQGLVSILLLLMNCIFHYLLLKPVIITLENLVNILGNLLFFCIFIQTFF